MLFTGPEFLLSTRYAQVVNTVVPPLWYLLVVCSLPPNHTCPQIFVTLLYCSGLPILVPICVCSLAVSYWVDKTLLCRFYRTPPLVSPTPPSPPPAELNSLMGPSARDSTTNLSVEPCLAFYPTRPSCTWRLPCGCSATPPSSKRSHRLFPRLTRETSPAFDRLLTFMCVRLDRASHHCCRCNWLK